MHEIHRPNVIWLLCELAFGSRYRGALTMRHLRPQIQALQRIQPVHAFAINCESLTTQKHVDAWITVTNTNRRDVLNPRHKHRVELARMRLVVERRLIYLQEATRASCADLKSCDEITGAVALLRRLYSVFGTMS